LHSLPRSTTLPSLMQEPSQVWKLCMWLLWYQCITYSFTNSYQLVGLCELANGITQYCWRRL